MTLGYFFPNVTITKTKQKLRGEATAWVRRVVTAEWTLDFDWAKQEVFADLDLGLSGLQLSEGAAKVRALLVPASRVVQA
jgi:hypothetical protein